MGLMMNPAVDFRFVLGVIQGGDDEEGHGDGRIVCSQMPSERLLEPLLRCNLRVAAERFQRQMRWFEDEARLEERIYMDLARIRCSCATASAAADLH